MRLRTSTAALVALALLAGCGGDDDDVASSDTPETTTPDTAAPTPSAEDDPNGEYCNVVASWTAHEFDGDGDDPTIRSDPDLFRKYWGEYVAFLEEGARTAPASLHDEWITAYEVPRVELTAVFEKYGYDVEKMEDEGTEAEETLFEPTAEQQTAQDAVHEYEARVCSTGQPGPADVSFEETAETEGYCDAVAALDGAIEDEVTSEQMSTEAMRAFLTSDEYVAMVDALEASAPAEIEEDVLAVVAWDRNEWLDAVEKYEYDIRKLFAEGTSTDRAAVNSNDPAIREQFARTVAYEEQLCGGGLFG